MRAPNWIYGTAIVAVVGLVSASSVSAGTAAKRPPSVLTLLSQHFSAARALPLGSRPTPPDLDLQLLVGLRKASIGTALGRPDRRNLEWPPLDCGAALCWSYRYGPGPVPLPDAVQHNGTTDEIIMSYGGPWLLILGFSKDRVVNARWLGQR